MILSAREKDKAAAWAEQMLVDVSAAFNHSFSLMEGVIGEASLAACGQALADKAVDACQQCQAVFCCDAEAEGVEDLLDALGLPLKARSLCVPEALCGRHEAPVALFVGSVLSLDEETLREAMRGAFFLAGEQECRLSHIAPNGERRGDWEAAVRVQEAACPEVAAAALTAPEAAGALANAPERMGLVLCPPYAGGILLAEATALCSHPELMHDMAFDSETGVYAPVMQPGQDAPSPFSVAMTLGKLLKFSLRLPREAACLEAAASNVMAARPARDAEEFLAPENVLDKICEQIAVAGELMQRAGLDKAN